MHLGLGLYRHQLNAEHYRFARQCGCTHLVIHLVDYFRSSRSNKPGDQPVGDDAGWGWLVIPIGFGRRGTRRALNAKSTSAGLELEAIENFDPAHWYHVLLDGPEKHEQLENLKTIIRNVGPRAFRFSATTFPSPGSRAGSKARSLAGRRKRLAWMGRSTNRCRGGWRGTWSTISRPRPESLLPRRRGTLAAGG